jgi:16S rRNA (guanine966-N2)-methyltransferase
VGPQLRGASVVDLFAGSGALGIEALSRGARHAHFVESNRAAVATLRANLESLDLMDSATVVSRDVFRWLARRPGRWDVALADPPYAGALAERLVTVFREEPFAACLWIEHAVAGENLGEPSWSRAYGDSRVSRFCSADPRPIHENPKGD